MGKQRRTWSAEVKEAIVLAVLRGEVSTAVISCLQWTPEVEKIMRRSPGWKKRG